MDSIKGYLKFVLEFTTGLGFYGLGLLGAAVGVEFFFGWSTIAAALLGAFVHKNFKAIVEYLKKKIK